MLVQNVHRIVRRPNVTPGQIPHCTTDCIPINLVFQENFPTTTQVRNTRHCLQQTLDTVYTNAAVVLQQTLDTIYTNATVVLQQTLDTVYTNAAVVLQQTIDIIYANAAVVL